MTLPIFDAAAVERAAISDLVFDTVRTALIAHAQGLTTVPHPMHLQFDDADGDCHVKAGMISGAADFTVKIATGFYRNHEAGLPSNHGLVCVISAHTGQIRALLDDRGLITAVRTAAAGALITHALARPGATTLGVFGAGDQARRQIEWLALLRPLGTVLIHSRSKENAAKLADELTERGRPARSASARETAGADMIITTTPATAPVLDAADVQDGAHVTGVGADMPHKNELPPALFARAALIVTDDREQCLRNGDFGRAVSAGATSAISDTPAGLLLEHGVERPEQAISIADLTGVGALDAALASAVLRELQPQRA